MNTNGKSRLPEIIGRHEPTLLADWIKIQMRANTVRMDLMSEADLRTQSSQFLNLFRTVTESGNLTDINGVAWREPPDFLAGISRSRALAGFSPSETATFIFSMKQPLFTTLRNVLGSEPEVLADEIWSGGVAFEKRIR